MTKDPWYDTDDPARFARGASLRFGTIVLLMIVLAVLLGAVGWAVKVAVAPIKGRGDQVIRTNDVNYRMPAYDKFFDLCGEVQATEDRIALARAQLAHNADPGRKAQLEANLYALQNVRAGLVREYNADASKTGTRGQFRASNLPYSIDLNQEHTTCAR